MFQFAGLAARRLWIQRRLIRAPQDQRSFVNFPRLFADFHALHRLLMPRHPPCALSSLTTNIQSSRISAADASLRTFFKTHLALGRSLAPDASRRCHLPLQPNCQRSFLLLRAGLSDRQKSASRLKKNRVPSFGPLSLTRR